MMKITMQDAILMEALVVTVLPLIGITTVIHANVSTQRPQHQPLQPLCKIMEIVVHPNGLMTTTVTMKITMQGVTLMGELAAMQTLQDGITTALIVNARKVKTALPLEFGVGILALMIGATLIAIMSPHFVQKLGVLAIKRIKNFLFIIHTWFKDMCSILKCLCMNFCYFSQY